MIRAGLVVLAVLGTWPSLAPGQARELHGRSVFASPGVTVVWGTLRGATERDIRVVIRIVVAGGAYTHVGLDYVDRRFAPAPRSIHCLWLDSTLPDSTVEVGLTRADLADFPRREIRLYDPRQGSCIGRPALTISYVGVPDDTPEFPSEAALATYLDDAVARSRPGRAP